MYIMFCVFFFCASSALAIHPMPVLSLCERIEKDCRSSHGCPCCRWRLYIILCTEKSIFIEVPIGIQRVLFCYECFVITQLLYVQYPQYQTCVLLPQTTILFQKQFRMLQLGSYIVDVKSVKDPLRQKKKLIFSLKLNLLYYVFSIYYRYLNGSTKLQCNIHIPTYS